MCGALAVISGHGLLIEEGHLGFLLRLLKGSLFLLVELLERLFFLRQGMGEPPIDDVASVLTDLARSHGANLS